MFFHTFFRHSRASMQFMDRLFAICLIATCLGAVFASEVAAREAAASQNSPSPVLMPKTPCPEGLTLEAWEKAPTLWRMAYSRCKPEGASTRRPFSHDDATDFIKKLGFSYPELGGFYSLFFYEDDSRTFRVAAAMKAESLNVPQAETITADILRRLVLYLETNGYNPKEEKLRLSSRLRALTDAGDVWVYAIFDNATGNIRYKMLPDE